MNNAEGLVSVHLAVVTFEIEIWTKITSASLIYSRCIRLSLKYLEVLNYIQCHLMIYVCWLNSVQIVNRLQER